MAAADEVFETVDLLEAVFAAVLPAPVFDAAFGAAVLFAAVLEAVLLAVVLEAAVLPAVDLLEVDLAAVVLPAEVLEVEAFFTGFVSFTTSFALSSAEVSIAAS